MNLIRTGNWRYVVAGALGVVGLLAAVLAWNSTRGRTTVPPSPRPADEPMPVGMGLIDVREAGVGTIVNQTMQTLSRRVTEAAMPRGEAIVADAGAIMRAWLGGSAEDYLAYLESNGHEPPPADVWQDPQRSAEIWLQMTRFLRQASFDPSEAFVRTSFTDGAFVPNEQSRVAAWRFDKLPRLKDAHPNPDQLAKLNIQVYEVVVPMRSESVIHGAQFNGDLALSYVLEPTSKEWVLVAVSVYDIPQGDSAVVPPF